MLAQTPQGVCVTNVMGQAETLGVPPMSIIVGVNGESVVGMSKDDLFKKISVLPRPLQLMIAPTSGQSAPPVQPYAYAPQLAQLQAMGFADVAAMKRALDKSNGDLNAAAVELSG